MPLHRFFIEGPLLEGEPGMLDAAQSRQVRSVLRLRSGDAITVFDGSGVEGRARLTSLQSDGASYTVESIGHPQREPLLDLTVGLALLRGDRFETAIQKLTEVGVRRIVPLAADRCVVSFRDTRDWAKRAVRHRRIIVEAMEQSERVTDVVLDAPTRVEAFLDQQPTHVFVERADAPLLVRVPLAAQMSVAIGPEGGWSERELERIEESATAVSLGGLILRAETAAIVAAGTIVQRAYSKRGID